jgi:hypothetical protein
VGPGVEGFKQRHGILLGLAHDWKEVFPITQERRAWPGDGHGVDGLEEGVGDRDDSVVPPVGVGGMVGQAAVLAGRATGSKFVKNAGQDLIDLPAETIPSIAKIAMDTIKDPKKGLKEITDPYKQLFEDPKGSFEKHPIYSLLLAEGARAGVSRAAGGVARTGALGMPR